MNVTKAHLVHQLSESLGTSKTKARMIIDQWTAIVTRKLMAGEEVALRNFGRLHVVERSKRPTRNFTTGQALDIAPGRVVTFSPSLFLKNYLNEDEAAVATGEFAERRSAQRVESLPGGRAVIRIAGFPVYEFGIKDVSDGGTCIVVAHDSTLLRNIWVGREIELQFCPNGTGTGSAINQRSEIRHITRSPEDPHKGDVLIGVKILSRLIL